MDFSCAAPLVISVIAFFIVIYVITQVLEDLQLYARDSGFLSMNAFFLGTFLAFFALGLYVTLARQEDCVKNCTQGNYLLASSAFYLFYILFTLNLTLRAEFYSNAARLPITTGAFWLFLAILVLLFLLVCNCCTSGLPLLALALIWCMYLIWNWVYRI